MIGICNKPPSILWDKGQGDLADDKERESCKAAHWSYRVISDTFCAHTKCRSAHDDSNGGEGEGTVQTQVSYFPSLATYVHLSVYLAFNLIKML